MSQFSGKQFKGAMVARRSEKRSEAEKCNRAANARMRLCGHVHGETVACTNPAVSA